MDIKTQIKNLVKRSVVLTSERKQQLLSLLANMNEDQQKQLLQILESEQDGVAQILAEKLKSDSSGELTKQFAEFKRKDFRNLYGEAEEEENEKEKDDLEKLTAEIDAS